MARESAPLDQEEQFHQAIVAYEQARDSGQKTDMQEFLARHAEIGARLAEFLADQEKLEELAAPLRTRLPEEEPAPEIRDYQILGELGRGGMGVVYKARQQSGNRTVALKIIRPDRLASLSPTQRRKAVERFQMEAQAAAQLEHPHIVGVYEVGDIDRSPFYSKRYVEGPSLAALVEKGPLEPRAAARYLEQVARAVHEAHRHGILHRDIKPANVLVQADSDLLLVADFGLAKLGQGEGGQTQTGDIVGTPPYMSPEQAQNSAHVTVASDIYSLGATL